MAIWDFRQLQQNIDKGRLSSVIMLFGEEDYLVTESLKLIKNFILQEGAVDFNYDQFYVGDCSAADVRDSVEMLPMMVPQRLVVYKGVSKLKEKDWEKLYPILDNPIDSTCFVLVADKIDKRKKYSKSVDKKGQLIELKRPYDNQVPAWIEYIAHSQGLKLNREANQLLQQLVGANLSDINSELTKLAQYLGDKKEAQPEDLLKVISKVRIDSVFDLTDAIGRKDRVAALTYLANLLDHGQNEVAAMALILRHIRILANIKNGVKAGLQGGRLSAHAGVSQYFLKQYMSQSRSWDEKQITKTIHALHETDKALKSSPVSSHIWLENFIVQTCG